MQEQKNYAIPMEAIITMGQQAFTISMLEKRNMELMAELQRLDSLLKDKEDKG